MSSSRIDNSKKNLIISGSAQVVTLLVTIISRAVFVRILNADYLGVNGLFSNVLSILAFSELGISSAIIYSMYKPVLNDDKFVIAGLLNLYKKAYRIVAVFIATVGVLVTPLIPRIINGTPDITEDLMVIYWLFLANTVCSYLFSYRKALFTVYQKEYVNVLIDRGLHALISIIQLVYLYYTHDFYGYLIILIIETLAINVTIHFKAGKKYKDLIDDKSVISPKERKNVISNIYNIFFYKIGSTILTSTNNIVISKILSITIVGIYSNYLLIITTLESILSKALNSIVASIGNLNATDDNKSKLTVLNELSLIIYWIYGFCAIELFILLDDTISLWVGDSYLFNNKLVVFAAVLSFYVFGTNFVASNYRVTMGFFKEGKWIPLLAAILNILLAVSLGLKFGLVGILFATSIARLITFGIFDPIIVHRKGLDTRANRYYFRQFYWMCVTLITGWLCVWVSGIIESEGVNLVVVWLLKAIATAIITLVVFFVSSFKTREFASLKIRLKI